MHSSLRLPKGFKQWGDTLLLPILSIFVLGAGVAGFYFYKTNASTEIIWIFDHINTIALWAGEYGKALVGSFFVDDSINDIKITSSAARLTAQVNLSGNIYKEALPLVSLGALVFPYVLSSVFIYSSQSKGLSTGVLLAFAALILQSTFWMTTDEGQIGYIFLLYAGFTCLVGVLAPHFIKMMFLFFLGLLITIFEVVTLIPFYQNEASIHQLELEILSNEWIGLPWQWSFVLSVFYLFNILYLLGMPRLLVKRIRHGIVGL